MKKFIAVTGGIGSGKSTVIDWIKTMGYPIFSCDEIYNEIFHDHDYICELNKNFKNVVVDGVINRVALRELVFSDKQAREKINSLAHPRVMAKLFSLMNACDNDLIFAEVPLLFEGKFEKDFDGVIVVMRDISLRIEAIRVRDGENKEKALEKIRSQFDYEAKESLRKFEEDKYQIIINNSSIADLQKQVEKSVKTFL